MYSIAGPHANIYQYMQRYLGREKVIYLRSKIKLNGDNGALATLDKYFSKITGESSWGSAGPSHS